MSGLWPVVGGVMGVVVLVIWGFTIADLIRARLGAAKTAAWLLIVILLPLIGSLLYWALRKPHEGEVEREYENELAMREARRRRPADGSSWGP
jgi:hypothetical protein